MPSTPQIHSFKLLVVLVQLEVKAANDHESDDNLDRLSLSRVQGELDRLGRANSSNSFTAAEKRVAAAVLSGSRNSDIALSEFISIRTVEAHLCAIYRKADVHSRTQLVAKLLTEANLSQ